MAFTTYLSNKILDHAIGKTSYTMPTLYVALFAGSPTITGAGGTEANYTGYARVAVPGSSWAAAASQADGNSAAIAFGAVTAGGGQAISHAATFDAPTGGNCLEFGALTAGFTTATGQTPSIGVGAFTRSLV